MSIAPPSDIILDVAQAADPRRLQAATAKLGAMAAGMAAGTGSAPGAVPDDFGALLAGAAAPKPAHAAAAPGASTLFQGHAGTVSNGLSPYQKFEAVLLQTFVQEMLPKDDKLFGDAASADAYRGMMAEQLAEQLARSGRIGIAKMIEHAHGPAAAPAAPIHAPTPAAAGAAPGKPAPSAPAPSAPAPSGPDGVA